MVILSQIIFLVTSLGIELLVSDIKELLNLNFDSLPKQLYKKMGSKNKKINDEIYKLINYENNFEKIIEENMEDKNWILEKIFDEKKIMETRNK